MDESLAEKFFRESQKNPVFHHPEFPDGMYCCLGMLTDELYSLGKPSKRTLVKALIHKFFGRLNPKNYHYYKDCDW